MSCNIHENNKRDIIWAVISLFIYIGGICGAGLQSGNNDTEEGTDSNLTADSWIFVIIWPIIYANQFIWHLYFIYQNLKQPKIEGISNEYCSYLMYSTHTIKGVLFFSFFIISNILQFSWWFCVYLSAWTGAAIVIFFYCLSIIVVNIISHKYFYDINTNNLSPSRIPSRNFYIISFLNGIQIYGTWLVLANMISWSGEFYRRNILKSEQSALVFEIVLIVILFIYLYLDLFRFREYLRYTYISYIVVILASLAILTENEFNFDLTSQIIVLIIGIFTLIMLIIKIIFIGYKSDYKDISHSANDVDQEKSNDADLNTQV